MRRWWALVDREVVGPFDSSDPWYHEHAGPDWRAREGQRSGADPWRVARTELGDGRAVSTVFLGLDHRYDVGPPVLFETAVLPAMERMMRTCTWAEAEAAHALVLAEVLADAQGGGPS